MQELGIPYRVVNIARGRPRRQRGQEVRLRGVAARPGALPRADVDARTRPTSRPGACRSATAPPGARAPGGRPHAQRHGRRLAAHDRAARERPARGRQRRAARGPGAGARRFGAPALAFRRAHRAERGLRGVGWMSKVASRRVISNRRRTVGFVQTSAMRPRWRVTRRSPLSRTDSPVESMNSTALRSSTTAVLPRPMAALEQDAELAGPSRRGSRRRSRSGACARRGPPRRARTGARRRPRALAYPSGRALVNAAGGRIVPEARAPSRSGRRAAGAPRRARARCWRRRPRRWSAPAGRAPAAARRARRGR